MTELKKPTLMVCLQCGSSLRDENGQKLPNPEAEKLAATLQAELEDSPVEVKLVRCFSTCAYPIAWGLKAENGPSYVFAPAENAAEIAETARVWVEKWAQGQAMKKPDMPDAVRKTLRAKMPPLPE
jgi:predicted metal-binding protein